MKIFPVKKEKNVTDEKVSIEQDEHIKIDKNCDFNYIIIKNPNNSNTICTVNDIQIISKGKANKVYLMVGEEELYRTAEENIYTKGMDMFKVRTKKDLQNIDSNLQISSNEVMTNDKCSMLEDFHLIVLPQGCLFIKLQENVKNLDIKLKWTSEKIQ